MNKNKNKNMKLETALRTKEGDVFRSAGIPTFSARLSESKTYRARGDAKPLYAGRGMDLFSEKPLRKGDLAVHATIPIVDDSGKKVYVFHNYLELVRRARDAEPK